MFKINKKIEYAMVILKYLDQPQNNNITNTKELSTNLAISYDLTAKVMQLLVQGSILKSSQGAHGGYSLNADLSDISYLNLSKVILGNIQIAGCPHDNPNCSISGSCTIRTSVNFLNSQMSQLFSNISMKELLKDNIDSTVDGEKNEK